MIEEQWFKIRSWHKVKSTSFFTSRANIDFTVVNLWCGRKRDFRAEEKLIMNGYIYDEKTCEVCLRLSER